MERKAFPRGGATEEDDDAGGGGRNQKNAHWLPTQKKKPSKKPRNDSESDPDADYELEERLQEEAETKVTIFDLTYKSIQPKMKLLGRVANVLDNLVEVYLPGAILGSIPMYNIVEMIGSSGVDRYMNAPELTDLFKIDQLIMVEVSNVVREAKSKQGKGTSVYLTVNPKNIYQGLGHRDVANVGFVLQAYVRSVEDHGYILDCGIQNLHVFLNKKECIKYCGRFNNDNPLVKGQIVRGVVIKAKTANVQSQVELSIEPGKVARAEKVPPNYIEETSQLLPGMRFKLEVTKKLSNGVAVNFDEFEGFVVERNIPHKLRDSDVGDSFMGCLLYVSKPLNVPMFSVVQSVVDSTVQPVREFNYGDIVKSAVVESDFHGNVGVLLNKKSGTRGRIPQRYRKNAEKESNSTEMHKIGNTVRCRLLDFDNLSETYLCTTLESAMKERIFSVSDVSVGSVVTATVTGFTDKALTVSVGAVKGYIQWYHTSDAPIKALAGKFNIGQKLKGKVLKCHGGKLDITAKESLTKKNCTVLKCYSEAIPGKSYPGTITTVLGEGFLVSFFGGVKGFVPFSKVDANFRKMGSSNIGRLVKCSVVSCKDEKLELALSDTVNSDNVMVGFKCCPIVSRIDTKNRTLHVVCGSSVRGVIPVYHLHDNEKLANKIFHTYSIGDVVEDARCFISLPVVFSTRGTVRRFFESEGGKRFLNEGPSGLQPGLTVPCFVKSSGFSGVTLSTPFADSDFVHHIAKEELVAKDPQVGDYFPLVVQDAENKKLAELVPEIIDDKAQTSVDFLSDILDGNKKLEAHFTKLNSSLSTFEVGEDVSGPVESTEKGYKVVMPNGVKGHVNTYCTDKDPIVGEIVSGKVIYIDYERSDLILSLQEIVKSDLLVDKNAHGVKVGTIISGRIVRGFGDFYLALVNANGALRRAFIPKQVYPSRGSPLAVSKAMVGKESDFTVIRKYGNDYLCVPTRMARKWEEKHVTINADKQSGNLREEEKKEKKNKRKRRKRTNSSSSSVDAEDIPPKSPKDKNVEQPFSDRVSEGVESGTNSRQISPKKSKRTANDRVSEVVESGTNFRQMSPKKSKPTASDRVSEGVESGTNSRQISPKKSKRTASDRVSEVVESGTNFRQMSPKKSKLSASDRVSEGVESGTKFRQMSPKKSKPTANGNIQIAEKSAKRKVVSKLGLATKKKNLETGFSKKVKNKRVLEAIVESVTGSGGKSPLVQSSDSTKKSLIKAKLGKNKAIFKGARKQAKRLKKSGTSKPVGTL